MSHKQAIKGKNIVYNGIVGSATILIEDGIVVDIQPYNYLSSFTNDDYKVIFDANDNIVVMGGLIAFNNNHTKDIDLLIASKGGITTVINIEINPNPLTNNNNKCVDVGLVGYSKTIEDEEIMKKLFYSGVILGYLKDLEDSGGKSLVTWDCSTDMQTYDNTCSFLMDIQDNQFASTKFEYKLSLAWENILKNGNSHDGNPLVKLSQLLSEKPALVLNVGDRKGMIGIGKDADFVIWDPEKLFTTQGGVSVHGQVEMTILKGQPVYTRGKEQDVNSSHFQGNHLISTYIQTSKTFSNVKLPPIQRANLNEKCFSNVANMLFESAPSFVRLLWQARPYMSYEELIEKGISEVDGFSLAQKMELLNSHPKIGAKPKEVSSLSFKEQGYDKLPSSDEAKVLEQLAKLNEEYQAKYGFIFMVFVNGRSKAEIIPVLEDRLHNSTKEKEIVKGISEFFEVAKSRLLKLR